MSDFQLGLSASSKQLDTLRASILEYSSLLPRASCDEAALSRLETRFYHENSLPDCNCHLVSKVRLVVAAELGPWHVESIIDEVLGKTCFWYNGRVDVCGVLPLVCQESAERQASLARVLRYEVLLRHIGVLVNLYQELGGHSLDQLRLDHATSIGRAPSSRFFQTTEGLEEIKGMQTAEEASRISQEILQLRSGERLTIGRSEEPLDGIKHLSLGPSASAWDQHEPGTYWFDLRRDRFRGLSRFHCLIEALGDGWYWLSPASPDTLPTNGLYVAEPGHCWSGVKGVQIVREGSLVSLGSDFVFKIPLRERQRD